MTRTGLIETIGAILEDWQAIGLILPHPETQGSSTVFPLVRLEPLRELSQTLLASLRRIPVTEYDELRQAIIIELLETKVEWNSLDFDDLLKWTQQLGWRIAKRLQRAASSHREQSGVMETLSNQPARSTKSSTAFVNEILSQHSPHEIAAIAELLDGVPASAVGKKHRISRARLHKLIEILHRRMRD